MVARADQPLTDGSRSALVAWAGAAQALAGGNLAGGNRVLPRLTGGRGPHGWVMVAQDGAAAERGADYTRGALRGNGQANNRRRAAEVVPQTSGAD